ncbi:MAG TPA: hypothetical protein VEN12_03855, partial [Verrucomicrobiae bacterium]|nr:hypothetical protein [Verrucomicrobiae bacterium]
IASAGFSDVKETGRIFLGVICLYRAAKGERYLIASADVEISDGSLHGGDGFALVDRLSAPRLS